MGRERGTFLNPANYEPLIAAPFDARSLVKTKADLIAAKTWTTADGDMWIYNGMMTVVSDDGANNGLYVLFNRKEYDKESSWIKLADYKNVYTKAEVDSLLSTLYRIKGSVDYYTDLPSEAKIGDVYNIIYADPEYDINAGDNVVWTGTQWDKLGGIIDLSNYVTLADFEALAIETKRAKYEIFGAPAGTLVDTDREKEIRIMCPVNAEWPLQQTGENANPNMYYVAFRAYAPNDDVVSFKEDMNETIFDNTMHYFEDGDFAGIDQYGRKYSVVWLAVAQYDPDTKVWSYLGKNSSTKTYIGWFYTVEWYDATGAIVGADTIRINLSNENCHTWVEPYYMGQINVNRLVQTDIDTVVLFGGTASEVN